MPAGNTGSICRFTMVAPGAPTLETWLLGHEASALTIMADTKTWQVR